MKSREIAVASILASLYVVIGVFIAPIAFGQYQCRVQDALYALIPLFGLSGVVGTFLGHVVFNVYGFSMGLALGPLDLLSPLVFVPAKLLLWRFGLKTVPLHVISVAVWVGFLLNVQFGVPLAVGVVSVGIGEFIAEVVLGVPLYHAIKRIIK